MLILGLKGMPYHAVVVFTSCYDFLFKFTLGHCVTFLFIWKAWSDFLYNYKDGDFMRIQAKIFVNLTLLVNDFLEISLKNKINLLIQSFLSNWMSDIMA